MDWDVNSVYTGNFDIDNLPDTPSKVIRVYIASTATGILDLF